MSAPNLQNRPNTALYWINFIPSTLSEKQEKYHQILSAYAGIIQHYKMENFQNKTSSLHELLVTALSNLPGLISYQGNTNTQERQVDPQNLLQNMQLMLKEFPLLAEITHHIGTFPNMIDMAKQIETATPDKPRDATLSLFILAPQADSYVINLYNLNFCYDVIEKIHRFDPKHVLEHHLQLQFSTITYSLNNLHLMSNDIDDFITQMRAEGEISTLTHLENYFQITL